MYAFSSITTDLIFMKFILLTEEGIWSTYTDFEANLLN